MKKLIFAFICISIFFTLIASGCEAEPLIEYIYTDYGTVIVYNVSNNASDAQVYVDISVTANENIIWAEGVIFAGGYFRFRNVPAGVSYRVWINNDIGNNWIRSEPFTLSKDDTIIFSYNGTYIIRAAN